MKKLIAFFFVALSMALSGAFSSQAETSAEPTSASQSATRTALAVPTPKKLMDSSQKVDSYLKGLGYTGSIKTIHNQNDYSEGRIGKYTLTVGSKTCTVTIEDGEYADSGCYNSEIKVTITGDPTALNSFYQQARKLIPATDDMDYKFEVTKQGNTVTIAESGC